MTTAMPAISAMSTTASIISNPSALSDITSAKSSLGAVSDANAAGFSTLFEQAVSDVNQQLLVSETGLQNLAAGQATNLHDVMISIEQAKLQFQLFMQIRNRALEAYQELMRTQV